MIRPAAARAVGPVGVRDSARVTPRPDNIRISVLDSRTTVITEHMPDVLSVTTGIWVGVGSRDEDAGHAGASHFLEHLLFKGTAERRAHEIAEAIDAVGGEMNAFTTKEYTAFHTRTLADDLELGLGLLCDIVSSPALRPEEVDAERQVILEEILMHADEPADLVHDLAHTMLYGDHGLGRETLGDQRTVASLTDDDIRTFMDASYVGETMVVAAAGRVTHEDVVDLVQARLHRPSSGAVPPRTGPDRVARSEVVVRSDDTEQAHLVVAIPSIGRLDPDRYALSVVEHVLGGGLSSRLFLEIRETRGLVYSVYSYRAVYSETGHFGIYAGTSPGKADEVLQLIDDELRRLGDTGITDVELRRAKGSLRGGTALGLEDSGSRMGRIGRGQLLYGEVPPIDTVLARTDEVTLADCDRVIERLLAEPRSLAVVGPFSAEDFAGHPVLG